MERRSRLAWDDTAIAIEEQQASAPFSTLPMRSCCPLANRFPPAHHEVACPPSDFTLEPSRRQLQPDMPTGRSGSSTSSHRTIHRSDAIPPPRRGKAITSSLHPSSLAARRPPHAYVAPSSLPCSIVFAPARSWSPARHVGFHSCRTTQNWH